MFREQYYNEISLREPIDMSEVKDSLEMLETKKNDIQLATIYKQILDE